MIPIGRQSRDKIGFWGIVVMGLSLTASHGFAAAATAPTHTVRELVEAIASMKDKTNTSAAATKANTIVDIPAVSRRVLGRHWKKRTPDEQQGFTALLTDLFVNVAYPKSAEFFGEYDIEITGENITGERAEVTTTVSDPKEGLISVDYRLHHRNGSWRVRDIVLDDVSLTRNLRSQCQKIIKEHSYAELLRRMQNKLNE